MNSISTVMATLTPRNYASHSRKQVWSVRYIDMEIVIEHPLYYDYRNSFRTLHIIRLHGIVDFISTFTFHQLSRVSGLLATPPAEGIASRDIPVL